MSSCGATRLAGRSDGWYPDNESMRAGVVPSSPCLYLESPPGRYEYEQDSTGSPIIQSDTTALAAERIKKIHNVYLELRSSSGSSNKNILEEKISQLKAKVTFLYFSIRMFFHNGGKPL